MTTFPFRFFLKMYLLYIFVRIKSNACVMAWPPPSVRAGFVPLDPRLCGLAPSWCETLAVIAFNLRREAVGEGAMMALERLDRIGAQTLDAGRTRLCAAFTI
jgi:hypothetical protein